MYQEESWWGKVTCCLPVYAYMIYAYECNSTAASHTCTVPQSISLFSVLESSTPIAQASHGTQAPYVPSTFYFCCWQSGRGCEKKRAGVWENAIYMFTYTLYLRYINRDKSRFSLVISNRIENSYQYHDTTIWQQQLIEILLNK